MSLHLIRPRRCWFAIAVAGALAGAWMVWPVFHPRTTPIAPVPRQFAAPVSTVGDVPAVLPPVLNPGARSTSGADPITCFSKEPTGERDAPAVADAVRHYAELMAQRLSHSGRPIDLAASVLVGGVADWPQHVLAAQATAVARAASLTSDPDLYGVSGLACRRVVDSNEYVHGAEACAQLNGERQLQLDPDNARLWLEAAAFAHEHDDKAAETEAIYHAANARKYESSRALAMRAVLAATRPGDPAELRYGLLHALLKEQRMATGHNLVNEAFWLSDLCNDNAVADSNHSQMCDALARNLLDHSTNSDSLLTGVLIARALKWSDDSLQPYNQKVALIYKARNLLPTTGEGACGGASAGLTILTATTAKNAVQLLRSPASMRALVTVERHRARIDSDEEPDEDADQEEAARH